MIRCRHAKDPALCFDDRCKESAAQALHAEICKAIERHPTVAALVFRNYVHHVGVTGVGAVAAGVPLQAARGILEALASQ